MSAAFTQTWSFPVDGPVSAVRMGCDAKVLVGSGSNAHVFDCREAGGAGGGGAGSNTNNPSSRIDLSGLASPISALACNKNCTRVVAGTDGGSLRLWDVETQRAVCTYSNCHRAAITSVEYHPFGEFIATASRDTYVRIWDPRKPGKSLQAYPIKASNPGSVEVVRYSPDGRWAVSGDTHGILRICDLMAGKMLHELPSNDACVTSLAFHPTRCNIAVASNNGRLAIWDAEKLQKVHDTSVPGATMVGFSERGLMWSGGGANSQLMKLPLADWSQRDVVVESCPWKQLDDLKCELDGTVFAAEKTVIGVSVTMIGAPTAAAGAGGKKTLSKAMSANVINNNNNQNQNQNQQNKVGGTSPVVSTSNSNNNNNAGPSYDSFFAAPAEQQPQQQQQQQRRNSKPDDQLVDEALNRSENMSALVQRRLTHTRIFRSLWQQHPDRALIQLEQSTAQDTNDCGATVDFFLCMQQQRVKEKITIEHVPSVLRLVTLVLSNHHRIDPFVMAALQAARYINSKFRHRVEETLRGASHAAPGVDLSMETRVEKARQCHRLLCDVRGMVAQFVARTDAVGEEARNLARDLPS